MDANRWRRTPEIAVVDIIKSRPEAPPLVPIDRRTVSIKTVAVELDISLNLAYKLAREDALPVPVIRIGERRMVCSRQALDDLLASPSRSTSASDSAA